MTKKARFGVRLPHSGPLATPENIIRVALEADHLGFYSVDIHDHVSHSHKERYHFAGGLAESVDEREKLGKPVTIFYEGVALLSYVAGITRRVKLVPASFVLPWRHPVLFAKQTATLHELSGGRLVVCVCIGNIETDFKAMNVSYKLKGKMMDEHLDVLKRIFSPERTTSFSGKFVSFPELEFYPKPRNLPIWIASGMNPIGYERVAKYGDGWLPGSGSPESFGKAIPVLDDHMKKRGRTVNELDIGRQTFLCIGNTADQARKATEYTVRSFYGGHEFDAMRDRLVDEAYKTSFANTPSGIIKLTEQFLDVGVNFHDMRLNAPSLESAVDMLRIFAREVLPSFA